MKLTKLLITDDLDGTPDADTVTFGYDNKTYEIDLSAANAEKLESLLAPYIEKGRPFRNGSGKRASTATATTRRQRSVTPESVGASAGAIRVWWQDNPIHLPTYQARGAIPNAVLRAYEQRDQTPPEPKPVEPEKAAPKQRRPRRTKAEMAAAAAE